MNGDRLSRPGGEEAHLLPLEELQPGRRAGTSPTTNAIYTVENALAKVKDDKGMRRVEKFLREDVCPDCGGTRLSEAARAPRPRHLARRGMHHGALRSGGVVARTCRRPCQRRCVDGGGHRRVVPDHRRTTDGPGAGVPLTSTAPPRRLRPASASECSWRVR